VGGCLTVFVIERKFRDEKQSAADLIKRYLFSLDVLPKGFRILRDFRFSHSATLECAERFNHGEGDEARFKEILDEASATVLYDRILMLLFAIHGKRTKRIQRANFGYRCCPAGTGRSWSQGNRNQPSNGRSTFSEHDVHRKLRYS